MRRLATAAQASAGQTVGVCTAQRQCPRLDYDGLLALTRYLVADRRWPGPVPIVARGCPRGIDGYTVGRRIRYADVAPICVVPHELAHLASGEVGHGPRWRSWFEQVASWCESTAR